MREMLESVPNLFIKQAEVVDLTREGDAITGVALRDGRTIAARAVVVTTGTFLNGLIHCGEQQYTAGRSGEPASVLLGESLKKLGPARDAAEDRHAASARWPHHRLGEVRGAARRQRPDAIQFSLDADEWRSYLDPTAAPVVVPHRYDHAGDHEAYPRERAPLAHVYRAD